MITIDKPAGKNVPIPANQKYPYEQMDIGE